MAKKLGANKNISGYGQTRWGTDDFKSLGIKPAYGSYSTSINRFVNQNRQGFKFLDIQVYGEEEFCNDIRLNRSRYCGVVPLNSAETGLAVADLSVNGAYGEDIAEIVAAIGSDVTVEFNTNLVLTGNSSLTPPIYLECMRYIDLFFEAQKAKWTKFEVAERCENRVRGMTNWKHYATKALADPDSALIFPNKFSSLTTQHPEWLNLVAILKFAIQTVTAPSVPTTARLRIATKLQRLRPLIQRVNSGPMLPTIHADDPLIIKELKASGILIMNAKSAWRCAWRVDQALLFEQYVQHIAASALKGMCASLARNPHIGIRGYRAPWTLSYLEPDAVARIGDTTCIIDAKYKSHIYNSSRGAEGELDEHFRHDLHQVLAYSAFAPTPVNSGQRCAMLVYPASKFSVYNQRFHSDILTKTDIKLHLVGMPFSAAAINDNVEQMQSLFRSIGSDVQS